jgi:hypothetical protein
VYFTPYTKITFRWLKAKGVFKKHYGRVDEYSPTSGRIGITWGACLKADRCIPPQSFDSIGLGMISEFGFCRCYWFRVMMMCWFTNHTWRIAVVS